jgi:DNA polymerase III delta prime subunit
MAGATLHATCVALKALADQWSGVLFCGPPGSGKSDLALRVIYDLGPERACLVADDYVVLHRVGRSIEAGAPAATMGKMEVRGFGILELPARACVGLSLAFDLVKPADVPRMPDPNWLEISFESGIEKIPLYKLAPFESSAVAKIATIHDQQARKSLSHKRPA